MSATPRRVVIEALFASAACRDNEARLHSAHKCLDAARLAQRYAANETAWRALDLAVAAAEGAALGFSWRDDELYLAACAVPQ